MNNKKSGLLASGSMLAEQREKLGLSVEECAESLKLSCTKVRALEAGDESPFISDVFIRGYLRSYAKLVQLPEDDVLYYYDSTDTNIIDKEHSQSHSTNAQSKWWLPYCIGLVLIVGWFIVSNFLDKDRQWLNNSSGQSTATKIVEAPSLVSKSPQKVDVFSSSDILSNEQTVTTEVADIDLLNKESVEQKVLNNISVEETEDKSSSESLADIQDSSVEVVESNTVLVTTEIQESIAETIVSEQRAATSSLSRLEFTFKEECWVQVVDANESIIESSLREANTSLIVTGEAPFAIILGNIVGTTMAFNGEFIPLSSPSGSNTLRITVGS